MADLTIEECERLHGHCWTGDFVVPLTGKKAGVHSRHCRHCPAEQEGRVVWQVKDAWDSTAADVAATC